MKTNRFLCALLTLAILIATFTIPVMAEDDISISVDGQKISWEDSAVPFMENNDIMLPLKKIVNALGGSYQDLETQGQQRKVAVVNSNALLVIVGSKEYAVTNIIEVDGGFTYAEPKTYYLDKAAAVKNGDVFFPLKHFCAATGVGINQTGNTVDFITKDEDPTAPSTPVVDTDEGVKVLLNGTNLTFDVPPQLINGRTMVPMRKIFEAMGAEVEWENDTQTITATKDNIVIIMQIDNTVISVSGKEIALDVPPQLIDSRTLVPVRAVAEGLDADVQWDEDTQTVIITKTEEPIAALPPTSEGKYNYSELSDNDMKKLKDSYNDLLQNFEKSSLSGLKSDANFAKEIKAKSDVAVKLVKDAWNKDVMAQIIDLQINSVDEYIVDGSPDLMQDKYMEIVKKAGLEANDRLDVSFMSLGDGSVTMFLDFKKTDTHFVIPVVIGADNTIEILQSKEMKEYIMIN